MARPQIAPLGRLCYPHLSRPDTLIHCRWCTARLLKINNAYLCPQCDCPDPTILADEKELPNV